MAGVGRTGELVIERECRPTGAGVIRTMTRLRACAVGAVALLLVMTTAAGARAARELLFDVQPVTLEGRTLVPLRPIFEWLGARVTYDQGHIRAWRSEEATLPQVELWIGSRQAKVAEASYMLDVAPQLLNGRCFVPLRFVAESFGVWVEPQGSQMLLRLPQENIEALMAIPPHPQTLQGKIWRLIEKWYGVLPADEPEVGAETASATAEANALVHWNLLSQQSKQEIIDDVGDDALTVVEAHWGGREVKGIRILQYGLDAGGVSGWARVMVGYPDGTTETERFNLVREPEGWKVRDVAPDADVPVEPTESEQ